MAVENFTIRVVKNRRSRAFLWMKDPDFFVVGLQKSGTFWVTALLNSHPEIRSFPALYGGFAGQKEVEEGRVFDMLASIDEDGGAAFRNSFLHHHKGFYADLVPLLDVVSRDELYDRFRDRYREWCNLHREGKRLVGDKTTEYIFHLDFIDRFYPNAKKLCILRDPKDRVVSWHFHQIRKGRKAEEHITDEFVREYCEERIRKEYKSMLAYGGHIHCFTYEHLTRNPDEVLRGVLGYLEADASPRVISQMIRAGSIEASREKDGLTTEAKGKKRGEEVRSSHYRKGIVSDWKNHLSQTQVDFVDSLLTELHRRILKRYNATP